MVTEGSKFLLKNIGFEENFLEMLGGEEKVFLIKREKMRKVASESAVVGLEKKHIFIRNCREEEDIEAYKEMHDCELYGNENEEKGNFYSDSNYFEEESQEAEGAEGNINNLSLFINCSQSQMTQLNRIVNELTARKEDKVLVKAYKSKQKSKLYKIYEMNSKEFKEKIKYKIFHKCNYPSCGRTFASSGWLRSHFEEHLKELKKSKFNILFENFLLKFNKSTHVV